MSSLSDRTFSLASKSTRPCAIMNAMVPPKTSFRGLIRGVQPRIRLTRSFDERQHSYFGYQVLEAPLFRQAPLKQEA